MHTYAQGQHHSVQEVCSEYHKYPFHRQSHSEAVSKQEKQPPKHQAECHVNTSFPALTRKVVTGCMYSYFRKNVPCTLTSTPYLSLPDLPMCPGRYTHIMFLPAQPGSSRVNVVIYVDQKQRASLASVSGKMPACLPGCLTRPCP